MPEPIETSPLPPDLDQELPPIKPKSPVVPQIAAPGNPLSSPGGSFVEYVAEDSDAYQVRTRSRRLFEVAKRRRPRTPYPPLQPGPLRSAYRWLGLAVLGLALSGLGALVLAPVAGLSAIQAQKRNLSPTDAARARLVVLLAGVLMALGAGLAFFFWLHVKG